MTDHRHFREYFPSLASIVHLASCSHGARSTMLDDALDTMLGQLDCKDGPWPRNEAELAKTRIGVARLIGARPEQIAVMPNATTGAFQVASGFTWARRKEIVTVPGEFPSIAHVWAKQACLRFTPEDTVCGFDTLVGPATALVSVPMITYATGTRLPVAEIARLAADRGAKVFVDGYQAVGRQPVDVDALGCDFMVFGSSKYLLGLPGVAFLYVRNPDALDRLPTLTGWFGRSDPFAFDPHKVDYHDSARRYEIATPSVPSLYATNAGLSLIGGLNMETVDHHVNELVRHAIERLSEDGITASNCQPGDNAVPAHVCIADLLPETLAEHLRARKVVVSPRGSVTRLSFHYYTSPDDVEYTCNEIRNFRDLRGRSPRAQQPERIRAKALAKLGSWQARKHVETFPFDSVMDAYTEAGKHFVSADILRTLDQLRADCASWHGEPDRKTHLTDFLNTLLDKPDGTYDYCSYCALAMLPLPTAKTAFCASGPIPAQRDRDILILIADLLAFECEARQGRSDKLPGLRPDSDRFSKRIRLGLNAASFTAARCGMPVNAHADCPLEEARRFTDGVLGSLSSQEQLWLRLSMQPVYTLHDEHMFLRILQLFETNFAWMAVRIRTAIDAFRPFQSLQILSEIEAATAYYNEARLLFPVLATMQRQAFQEFRSFTEGASAIQSRNYKLLESLCRVPTRDRRDSLAYTSVPEIRSQVLKGLPNLDAAFAQARQEEHSAEDLRQIAEKMANFAQYLQRWRQTHYSLAVKMLGSQTGTGYTEGTPYLSAVRGIPVFETTTEFEGI